MLSKLLVLVVLLAIDGSCSVTSGRSCSLVTSHKAFTMDVLRVQRQELLKGDHVRVRMSPNPVPTINKADQTTDWFESLDRCFGWNERMEQKPLEEHPKPKALSGESQNGSVSV